MCARGSHVGNKVGQVLEEAPRTACSSFAMRSSNRLMLQTKAYRQNDDLFLLFCPGADMQTEPNLVSISADIVSAYVSNNNVKPGDIAPLLSVVHTALANIGKPPAEPV